MIEGCKTIKTNQQKGLSLMKWHITVEIAIVSS